MEEAYERSKNVLSSINHVFHNYTIHNEIHSLNIMKYMADMITDIEKLSSLDTILCIYAALFHDIRMVVYDDEIDKIKSKKNPLVSYDFSVLMTEYKDEKHTFQECIRPIHGKRIRTILERGRDELEKLFLVQTTTISFVDNLKYISST